MPHSDRTDRAKGIALRPATRAWLIVGTAVCAGAIIAILIGVKATWPDLLLGVLATGALLCLLLAIIGRLPSGFEIGGLALEFETEELSDLIGTIRSSLDDVPEARDRILRLIKEGTGSKAFKEASSKVETRGDTEIVELSNDRNLGPASGDATAAASLDPRERIRKALADFAPGSDIEEYFDVPTSGKGKPPRFDFYLKNDGIAVEFEQYWNATTVDLVSRKAARALRKGTPVDVVVVVTPAPGVSAFENMSDKDEKLLVMSLDDFTHDSLRCALDR